MKPVNNAVNSKVVSEDSYDMYMKYCKQFNYKGLTNMPVSYEEYMKVPAIHLVC